MTFRPRSFLADKRGVAAMEFAFIAPVLIALYLGAVELTLAFQAQTRLAHMASAMADMAAQNRAITTAQVDDVMQAGSVMTFPLPAAPLGQRIASISRSSTGVVTVDWTRSQNFECAPAPTVPAGFLNNNESVIVADVRYEYPSTFSLILPPTMRFERHAYLRPRLSDKVELQ